MTNTQPAQGSNGCVAGFGIVAAVLVLALVIGAVSRISNTNSTTSPASVEDTSIPTPWLQDIAKNYAGKYLSLKDPDSAIYTDTTYRTRHGVSYICGFVNAKNGFGAYVGPDAFIIGGGTTYLGDRTPERRFQRAWRKECVETDATDSAKAKLMAPEHPHPSSVDDQGAREKLLPMLKLSAGQSADFSHVTYRTRYGIAVTCGQVSVSGARPERFVAAGGSLTRERGAPTSFEFTWQQLCVTTDAMQDAEDRHRR